MPATPPAHPVPDDPAGDEIRIGISACLLGEEVRYDGGHKLDRYVRDTLGAHVRFVPLCPEVDVGMGVPRPTVRLEVPEDGDRASARMIEPASGADHTEAMLAYARRACDALERAELCGFLVKKGSPSCGMERVPLYPSTGAKPPRRQGTGLFTRTLMERFPHLPVEEEGRLQDPLLRASFVTRIFAYRRIRTLFRGRWSLGDLVAFHSREKLLLLAHHRPAYQELGRLVAAARGRDREELAAEYEGVFLDGLRRRATRRKHTNVLQHIAGYFKELLDDGDRAELHDTLEQYRAGLLPLVVPVTLLRHHVRRHGVDYLADQTYLEPSPRELMLQNHV